jgi:DNA-binding XRE family transcriptional regulator
MPILKSRKVWKKTPAPTRHVNRLSPDEVANVMAAMRVLRGRHGTWVEVARAMGLSKRTVVRFASGEAAPTAGMAIRVARLAGVSIDDVLSGEFAKPRMCPTCGREM